MIAIIDRWAAASNGKQEKICFSDTRCGVSWPTSEYPGYYCVLGLLHWGMPGEKGSLRLLGEGERELLGDLIEALIREAEGLRFSKIYADGQSAEGRGMWFSAEKMIRGRRDRQQLRLRQASFAGDFDLGVDLVRTWGQNGALVIPEGSILHRYMLNPIPEGIQEGVIRSLYPVNALRYVARSFENDPFRQRQESSPPLPPGAWT